MKIGSVVEGCEISEETLNSEVFFLSSPAVAEIRPDPILAGGPRFYLGLAGDKL